MMNNPYVSDQFQFYAEYTDIFLRISDELLDIFETVDFNVDVTDKFSQALLTVYNIYMLDIFPSCQMLVKQQNFFSFAILCRSALDIVVQLMFILDRATPEDKQKAIELFLSFTGKDEYINYKGAKRSTYQWQDIILKDKFIYSQQIKTLGAGCHFDYLSKVTHWNPTILQDFVGIAEGHVVFGPEKGRMFFYASQEFICSTIRFILIFTKHFYPDKDHEISKKALELQKDFFSSYSSAGNRSS